MIEKLIGLLSDYFNIGDSYHYTLGRSKEAFGMGTMSLYDFTEYGEDDAADLAEFLMENGVTVQRWIPVTERLPEENDRYLCNVKSFAFPGCFYHAILQYDKHVFREGSIYTDDVAHWMYLPEPPKEVE